MIFLLNEISKKNQLTIASEVYSIIKNSPMFRPRFPKFNNPFKILITNAGQWGWISDIDGYRYTDKHPQTKKKWPAIPNNLILMWKKYSRCKYLPNSCLINLYTYPDSKLGVHKDKDENNFSFPVLSISLGSSATFKYGKQKKKLDKICLVSGSIVIMKDQSRLDFHGVSKIFKTENNILEKSKLSYLPMNSRINITMRIYEP